MEMRRLPSWNSLIFPQILRSRGRNAAPSAGTRAGFAAPKPGVSRGGACNGERDPSLGRATERAACRQSLRPALRPVGVLRVALSPPGEGCLACGVEAAAGPGFGAAAGARRCRRTWTTRGGTLSFRLSAPTCNRQSTERCAIADSASAREIPGLMIRPCACFRFRSCPFCQEHFAHCRKPRHLRRRIDELPAHHAARQRPRRLA